MNLKVGDKVRVLDAGGKVPGARVGNVYEVAEINIAGFWLWIPGAKCRLWWRRDVGGLEPVTDRKSAHILTEKVMVGDTPCRKIVGFEGILGHDELPDKYLEGTPRFVFNPECNGSRFIFNGEKIEYVPCAGKPNCGVVNPSAPCGLDAFSAWRPYECLVKPGDVLPEPAFQELLTWLKRAGSRLAKIRKQEKVAWAGEETVEI